MEGATSEAADTLRRAVDPAQKLLDRSPDNTEYLELLAVAEARLCILLEHTKAHEEAETVARAAVAHRQRLAAEFPGWVAHQMGLGGALGNLGMALMRQKRHEEALELHKQAIVVQKRLWRWRPAARTCWSSSTRTARTSRARCSR